MRLGQVAVIAILLAHCCSSLNSQKAEKLWSIDLRTNPEYAKRLSSSQLSLTPASVVFAGDSRIILSFYDDLAHGYHRADPSENYHLIGISADDGVVRERLVFSTFDHEWRVHSIVSGGLLVIGNQKIMKYRSTLELQMTRTAPEIGLPDLYYERWMADCVPDGSEVVLYHSVGPNKSEFIWMNTNDLSRVRAEPTEAHQVMRASNSEVITEKSVCDTCADYFLAGGRRFVDRGKKYEVRDTNGKSMASGSLRGGASHFARSMSSSRVAFIESVSRFNGIALFGFPSAIAERVTVLDWERNRRVAEIDLEERITNPWDGLKQSALALSPHGKLLVVLLRYSLTCYRLR